MRICRERGILCKVELDNFLIYADSFESCLNSVNFVVDLFKYFGIKINFAKSSLIPPQTIDFRLLLRCSEMSFYTHSGQVI